MTADLGGDGADANGDDLGPATDLAGAPADLGTGTPADLADGITDLAMAAPTDLAVAALADLAATAPADLAVDAPDLARAATPDLLSVAPADLGSDDDLAPALPLPDLAPAGVPLGAACQVDDDCASHMCRSFRMMTVLLCTQACTLPGKPDPSDCPAPSDGTCTPRGYCRF